MESVCFGCEKAVIDNEKSVRNLIREMYRNTKQLPKYRQIDI